MKLKEAVGIAQWINLDEPRSAIAYIATDPDGAIQGYTCEPYINDYEDGWRCYGMPTSFLGWYEGDKYWSNTCRKV